MHASENFMHTHAHIKARFTHPPIGSMQSDNCTQHNTINISYSIPQCKQTYMQTYMQAWIYKSFMHTPSYPSYPATPATPDTRYPTAINLVSLSARCS